MGAAAPLLGVDEQSAGSGELCRQRHRHLNRVGGTSPRADGRTESVLLVEDDPAMRLVCTYNLEADGFHVLTATTGREALDLAAREEPDLVLLDVMLPDLGGFEVAERLRDLPIVFLSARAAEADLERGRAAGAIDYVTKPFDPVALPSRLREDLEELRRGGVHRVWTLRFGASDQSE